MDNEELRKIFNEEIVKTEQHIIEYQEMTKPVSPDVSIGRISRIDAINNKSVAEEVLRQSQDKLHKLKYLFSTIGSPDFGICKKCKTQIPIKRILIKPESMFCVNCAK